MKNFFINAEELKKSELTFKSIYRIMFSNKDLTACEYLDNNEIVKWTYEDYNIKIKNAAGNLQTKLGQGYNSRYVGIKLENSPEWPIVFWALLMAGYKPILIDNNFKEDMTDYLLTESNAAAIIVREKLRIKSDVLQIKLEEVIKNLGSADFKEIWENEFALCTSGTTSTSKIYVYNGEAVSYQLLNTKHVALQNNILKLDGQDKVLAFLPFHHVFGFLVVYMWFSFLGSVVVYTKDRAPETILNACRRHKITQITTVPLLLNNIANGIAKKVKMESPVKRILFYTMVNISLLVQRINLKAGLKLAKNVFFKSILENLCGTQVQGIISGGTYIPRETLRVINGLGYYATCGFGMTEVGISSVEIAYDLDKRLGGSLGEPLPNVEYKIVKAEGKDRGELFIRGKVLHTGRIKGGVKIAPDFDEEGWFATGDIGRIDKGVLKIEGRIKDVIINESGENVYPDELENYFSSLNNVNQLCVLGTKRTETSEYITLMLSMRKEDQTEEQLQAICAIINKINRTLPVLKRVNKVCVTSELLPATNTLKVKRQKLKELIEGDQITYIELDLKNSNIDYSKAAPAKPASTDDMNNEEIKQIKQEISKIFSEVLSIPLENIKEDSHFIDDLGGDSLNSISLMLKVEETYNIIIDQEEYYKCTNVNELALLAFHKIKGIKSSEEAAFTSGDQTKTAITRFEDSREFKVFDERQKLSEGLGNPYFVCHDSIIRDKSLVDGNEVLNFGSYNYIGMSGHPETVKAAQEAAERYGTSASGSRLLAGEKHLYQELEKEIAKWKHTEDAIVLVGGHSTNVTFVGNFCNENDLILYDSLSHNSIIQGCQLSKSKYKAFPHNDYKALEGILRNTRNMYEKVLLVVEGAYSMDGDIAPIPEFVRLKNEYGLFLMVDEAHSACVLGEHGGGVDEYFNLNGDDIDIKMGTLSKGLGTCGGYLAGKRSLIEYLRYNVPGFVFSVGINPPSAAATLQAIRILSRDNSMVKRLHENIKIFMEEAHKRNLNTCLAGETAIIPILIGQDQDAFVLSSLLLQNGVSVPPAVFPAVQKGQARLRFCVTSEHKKEQIVKALDLLVSISKEKDIKIC